jgi:HPt (histidine-containing phosphotransfer) domain-containing protein
MDESPAVDKVRLDLITRGDPALAREFLSDLIDEAATTIENVQTAIAGNDQSRVRALAHTLKGMSAEVGAARLRAAAAALESETDPAMWDVRLEGARAALADLRSVCGR